jgi:hypothetical protein
MPGVTWAASVLVVFHVGKCDRDGALGIMVTLAEYKAEI